MTLVVAAVFKDADEFLMFRRAPGRSHQGCWEFPGGKVEPEETPEEALRREIWEELAIRVTILEKMATARNDSLELQAFAVKIEEGCIQLRDHDQQVCLPARQLLSLPMTELDRQIVEQLIA